MKMHIRLRRRATPTERISSFADHLIQSTAKIQKLYLKDTTDFLNFIEKTKVGKKKQSLPQWTLLDFTLTSHRRKDVCKTYETFYGNKLPIPTHFLREMLRIILKENSFHFNGTPMETKWQYLFLISLWWKLRLISSTKALTNHSFGKDSLRTSFLDGT